ncbi:hypothetical protein [Enterococcus saccharolyticus]
MTRETLLQMEAGLKNRVVGDQTLLSKERLSESFTIYDASGQKSIKQFVS